MMFQRWGRCSADRVSVHSNLKKMFLETYHDYKIMVYNKIYAFISHTILYPNFNIKNPDSHLSKCRNLKSITFKMHLLYSNIYKCTNQIWKSKRDFWRTPTIEKLSIECKLT